MQSSENTDYPPLAYFRAFANSGSNPTLTYPAVPAAVDKALQRAGIDLEAVDLIEIQEAFAVQALADARLMGIDPAAFDQKINVNGSGISLGHPIAATGAMRLVTLVHEMKRRNARYGLEIICGGGGLGICAVGKKIVSLNSWSENSSQFVDDLRTLSLPHLET